MAPRTTPTAPTLKTPAPSPLELGRALLPRLVQPEVHAVVAALVEELDGLQGVGGDGNLREELRLANGWVGVIEYWGDELVAINARLQLRVAQLEAELNDCGCALPPEPAGAEGER